MKIALRIALIVAFATSLVIGCSKYTTNQDCEPSADCYPYEIDSGYVTVNVSYNAGGPGIPVVLYDGYVEDDKIIWSDLVYENEVSFWLPTKKRYAAEAYYQIGGQWTVTLDGKKLKEKSYDDCGQKCYEVNEIILDLKKL